MANATALGIAVTIFTVFFMLSTFLPSIYEGFNQGITQVNTGNFVDQARQEANKDNFESLSFIESLISVFFWSFGLFPFWLEMVFSIFRVTFILSLWVIFLGGN